MLFLCIFVTILCGSLATDPPCPKVPELDKNFDLIAHITGKWYGLAIYENILQQEINCMFVQYTERYDNNSATFYNSHLENGKVVTWEGMTMPAMDDKSQIITKHYLSDEDVYIPIDIIKTEVERYAIGYKCLYDEDARTRTVFAWILSRTRTLDDSTKQEIQDYINASPIIDNEHLIWDKYTAEQCEPVDSLTIEDITAS